MARDDDQVAHMEEYDGGYNNSMMRRPPALLNSIFMATVNKAAKALVAVASTSSAEAQNAEKWKAADHMRFMVMLMTWMVVWVLRILMDHFPCSSSVLPSALQYSNSPFLLTDHDGGFSPMEESFNLPSSSSSLSSTLSSLDLVLHQAGSNTEPSSIKALGRALSHVFALLNETPASSRKYQFAVAMADKIVEENSRQGNVELLQINRTALASAFARTSGLLYRSLQRSQGQCQTQSGGVVDDFCGGSWVIKTLPLGSFFASYLKSGLSLCLGSIFSGFSGTKQRRQLVGASGGESSDIVAEKHAHELLWITNKLRACGAVDEALVQWSLASGLASLSLTGNPRVQGFIVKISAILIGELTRGELEVPRQIKYRLLVLWLPLFCYAENGLAYPVLSGYEKGEMERTMDELISTLPALDQEVILTNWLQDFTISTSDWPNLQMSYDRWCRSTRKLITVS
ncbi:uncharacterized protein LOC132268706 [Cornus florida]|uniref:uncharacterized protein LOC132268706 n=1 Tax=Cornus florida TaxID=4283 RepID=UPI0028A24A87|nr:uncharacterized protein LOC132268706 [Cornus florida]